MLRRATTFLGLVALMTLCSGAAADDPPRTPVSAKTVVVELLLVDMAPGEVPPETSVEQLLGLVNQQKYLSSSRVRLTTLEGTPADVQIGETLGVQVGRSFPPRGGPGGEVANYQMQNTGLLVRLTPTIQDDGSIRLELAVERSRLETPKTPPKAPATEGAAPTVAPFVPPKTTQFQTKSMLRLSSGKAMLAASHQPSNGEAVATFAIVTATAR